MHVFRHTASNDGEELGRAIPGSNIRCVADSGSSFGGAYSHIVLDGLVVSRLAIEQASIVSLDERTVGFTVWHVISPGCSSNGNAIGGQDIVMVRPGEGGTMRSTAAAQVATFSLHALGAADAPDFDMPFGRRSLPPAGRWRVPTEAPLRRFADLNESVTATLAARPQMIEIPALRMGLRNAFLEAIAGLGESGAFQPDRAAVGRHTRIMLRFERALEEFGDEPADMAEICRLTGTSRRSLEAVVRLRTGRSPWEYLRWRRLWRARALLGQPTAETTVTDVAFRLGFWHLGRFAAAYAAAFGEAPSSALNRARGTRAA
jgi:AraC-like DNA-binding protein